MLTLLLSGCKKDVWGYVVDLKIDLTPVSRDLYDGATIEIKSSTDIITAPLELSNNLGVIRNVKLPTNFYSLTITFFSGSKQVFRCTTKEGLAIKKGYMVPPLFTLVIADEKKPLTPIIIGQSIAQKGEQVVLDGTLSQSNKCTTFTWEVIIKTQDSILKENLGHEKRITFNFDQPGNYVFVLTLDDGVNRQVETHMIDVADKWLTFGEPIIDIKAVKNNSLAILHGIPSKLTIYNDSGSRSIELDDTYLMLGATKKSDIIVLLSLSKIIVYDLNTLDVIAQFNTINSPSLAVTDENHVLWGLKNNNIMCWSLGVEPKLDTSIPYYYSKLRSNGERVFISNTELILDDYGRVVNKVDLPYNDIIAFDDEFFVDKNCRLFKYFLGTLVKVLDLRTGAYFSGGTLNGDYGAFINYQQGKIERYNIKTGELLQTFVVPLFGLDTGTKVPNLDILEDGSLYVLYEPYENATFSEAVIGVYK